MGGCNAINRLCAVFMLQDCGSGSCWELALVTFNSWRGEERRGDPRRGRRLRQDPRGLVPLQQPGTARLRGPSLSSSFSPKHFSLRLFPVLGEEDGC